MAFKHSTKHNITHYIEIFKNQAMETDLEMTAKKIQGKNVKRTMINMLIYSRKQ